MSGKTTTLEELRQVYPVLIAQAESEAVKPLQVRIDALEADAAKFESVQVELDDLKAQNQIRIERESVATLIRTCAEEKGIPLSEVTEARIKSVTPYLIGESEDVRKDAAIAVIEGWNIPKVKPKKNLGNRPDETRDADVLENAPIVRNVVTEMPTNYIPYKDPQVSMED